jgi:hypothetical protein
MTRSRLTLPAGMMPRLISRDAAAAYCGVVAETFEEHVRPHVRPIEIGARRLWDVKALDRWLDECSGLAEVVRPIGDWLAGIGDDAEKNHGSGARRQ